LFITFKKVILNYSTFLPKKQNHLLILYGLCFALRSGGN